jgi:hypothetical protein
VGSFVGFSTTTAGRGAGGVAVEGAWRAAVRPRNARPFSLETSTRGCSARISLFEVRLST